MRTMDSTESLLVAVGKLQCLALEGGIDFRRVKADNRVAVNDGDRRSHESEPLQFLDRAWVLSNIAFLVPNLFLRKILFRPLAEHSARLRVDRYLLRHCISDPSGWPI
jgi:hypothetical protein